MRYDYKFSTPVEGNINPMCESLKANKQFCKLVNNAMDNSYYTTFVNHKFLSHNQLVQRVNNYKEKFEKARLESFNKSGMNENNISLGRIRYKAVTNSSRNN